MADNKRNAKRLRALAEEEEAESQRIAAELAAAGSGSGVYGGVMAWPVPASQRITSPYRLAHMPVPWAARCTAHRHRRALRARRSWLPALER